MECPLCLEILPPPRPKDRPPAVCPTCGERLGRPWAPVEIAGLEPDEEQSPERVAVSEPAGVADDPIPFVGRAKELERLTHQLGAGAPDGPALAARPRLVIIAGEAGLGKSRLLTEALRSVARPPRWVRWRAEAHAAEICYQPALAWVAQLAGIEPEMAPAEVDRRLEELVARTLGLTPADAAHVQAALGTAQAQATLAGLPEEHVWRNLHRVLGQLMAAQAGEQGLCLIVDQAQWIDGATGRWLDEVLDGLLGVTPLTVAVLTRERGAGWSPGREPDLTLDLKPLKGEERGRLFDAVTPAIEFLPELRRRVIEQSAGTPLFLRELGRLVAQVMAENAGPISADQVASIIDIVPLSLAAVTGQRIARVERHTRWLLDAAAVLGPEFSLGLLECFDEIRDGLEGQLQALEGLHFLRRREGPGSPRYHFIEGHVRDLAYDALLPEQKRALHRQVAEAIERAHAGRLEEHYEKLAWHYAQAEMGEPATVYRIRAADRQLRLGETKAALASYERALDQVSELEATTVNQTRMARLLVRQGRLLRHDGQNDGARALLEAAASLADRLDNEHLRLQAGLEQTLLDLWSGQSAPAANRLAGLQAMAGQLGDANAECTILNALGVLDWHGGRFEEALTRFRELAEKARAAGAQHLEADALNNTGLIYWRWSRYPEAAKSFRAASALRLRLADRFGLVASQLNLAIIQEQLGEIRPALRNYREALELARQTGFCQGQAVLEVNLSNLERRAGLLVSALDHAARAVDLARRAEDPLAELTALENLGLAQAAAGRPEAGRRPLEFALELARRHGAAEKEIQVELDLLELASRHDGADPFRLTRAGRLLGQVEAAGYRDLLPQACRLLGRLLCQREAAEVVAAGAFTSTADTQGASAPGYENGGAVLRRALDYAVGAQNLFEERDALRELLTWGEQASDAEQVQCWGERAERIGRLVRLRVMPEPVNQA